MTIRVMIVDDVPETCANISKLLSFDEEIEVVGIANNGKEAIDLMEKARPDVLLMDINMPVMDGITLITEIRKIDQDVPILALTSESDVEMRNRGVEAGANGWIVKPFHGAQFLDIVRQILS